MKSRITGGPVKLLFRANVLNKYDVGYYECVETGFIQTETPYWLDEAYSSAITKPDIGLLDRNIRLAQQVAPLLVRYFNHEGRFLDFAGGYGTFARLMRDKGFDYYTADKYCENIFAEYYDLEDMPGGQRFELVTAFEVFEHLVDPVNEIPEIFAYSDDLLFTTELVPHAITRESDWWYVSPQTGQHVSLYTLKSLEYLASSFGKTLYSDGKSLHLFSSRKLDSNPFASGEEPFWIAKIRRVLNRYDRKKAGNKPSLIERDFLEGKKNIS